jgi:hypothetical protein
MFDELAITQTPIREDEEFVISAIATSLSGTWLAGENPPDAYLPHALASAGRFGKP